MLNIDECSFSISNSAKSKIEESSRMVRNMKLKIESHNLASNFAVGGFRYDVILVMPWHKNSRLPSIKKMVK